MATLVGTFSLGLGLENGDTCRYLPTKLGAGGKASMGAKVSDKVGAKVRAKVDAKVGAMVRPKVDAKVRPKVVYHVEGIVSL